MTAGTISTDLSMANMVDNRSGTIRPALFSHPAIYEQELEQIFSRMWLFVGHESQIPHAGDFVRSRMGEEQVIVTRGRDNQIYVLLNSCSHRGNMVCRYDRGRGLAFQCSFHGWTFDSTGRLINLPPGMEEEYTADLRKEEWGLLQARVETFQGTIWANWDKTAPSFREYLGEAAAYLSAGLSDAEGNPDGTELAGGIMKWRVGMNWKVPMPDMDTTHGWITHRSARPYLAGFGRDDRVRARSYENAYHIWFPEGHTHSMTLRDDDQENSFANFGEYPMLRDYLRERWAKRRERLGKLAQEADIPHVFPNAGSTVGRMLRILHPQGPAETEMWSYILVDKAMPPEVKEATVLYHQRRWGPNGMIQKDDMENWYIQTRYSKGFATRWRLRQNNQLAMSKPSLPGPSTVGLPGMFHPEPTDENYRRYFEHYALVMEARSWEEILAGEAAKLREPGKVLAGV
jgi:phenylpropionate dioxygenase-like ring-hydroxylating dioxygenase large terminal subunit